MRLREKLARELAAYVGDNFDCIHRNKAHWRDEPGEDCVGQYRDVNALRRDDYLDLADIAIARVVEECARVADDAEPPFVEHIDCEARHGFDTATALVAHRIRALAKPATGGEG